MARIELAVGDRILCVNQPIPLNLLQHVYRIASRKDIERFPEGQADVVYVLEPVSGNRERTTTATTLTNFLDASEGDHVYVNFLKDGDPYRLVSIDDDGFYHFQ
jgi:hypothetical protein